jgi:hypothetical protein
MKYLGTSFSLTLGCWRLRIRIELDDEPEDSGERPVTSR